MIVGIDADVNRLAYAAVRRGKAVAIGTIERTDNRGQIRADYDARLNALMRRVVQRGAVVHLEGIYLSARTGPGGKRNVATFAKLAEVAGEIKVAARAQGVEVITINPAAWQSSVLPGVKGREAIKAASLELAQRHWGRPLTSHEADAFCVALHRVKAAC